MNQQLIDIITRILDDYPTINMPSCYAKVLLAEKITDSIDEKFEVQVRDPIIKNEHEQVLFDFNGIE